MQNTNNITTSVETAPPHIMVIFGAGGDLTRRKLIPALYYLCRDRLVPEQFAVLGIDRHELDVEVFRERLDSGSREFLGSDLDDAHWQRMLQCVQYLPGDFTDPGMYQRLAGRLAELTGTGGLAPNFLFYLATPPRFFIDIAASLARVGLLNENAGNWRRVIIEKPFGNDLQSARDMNRQLHEAMDEHQIYRIDHYLGKETVQNILAFRFANSTIEPIWNRQYIDHVQITVSEAIGVAGRGSYYDQSGALRDMIPNHLLAVLSIVAMEPSNSFNADAIRDEQTKVLRAIQPFSHDDVLTSTVRGQYGPGTLADGTRIPGYREEPEVAADSKTETYTALKLMIDSWRWAGVPFYLRTGKCLPGRFTEIVIQYKHGPNIMFRDSLLKRENVPPNTLVLRLQPNEGIGMNFNAKVPGHTTHLGSVQMNFRYDDYFDNIPMTGYETLLHDCMTGDATLFKRADNIEAGWELVDPVLEVWSALPAHDFPNYAAGTWGPAASEQLLARDGCAWRACEACHPGAQ
ncbi:MAG: glucose-6-phosphate dehydrogenase [Gammaproteobacteria bacterium]|nr:glucose-6-phosphate dehydrogenase [Gammaproteobacteria bacterium]